MADIGDVLTISRFIPVVVLDRSADAPLLAETLLEAGIGIMEITLRTDAALPGIEAVARRFPQLRVGAGTIWNAQDLASAVDAGASFGVSPGTPAELLDLVRGSPLPFLPGAQTAAEMATLAAAGFSAVKFFPAAPAGGPAALRALADVLPTLEFCPTGGITLQSAPEYLSLPNVPCVAGSWLTPRANIRDRDWAAIAKSCQATHAAADRLQQQDCEQ